MAIFNCKSCGGDLEITDNTTVVTCEYCGRQQTVPSADNEKKVNLFNRANRLRSKCEFDKAASVYESIVAEFPQESEAYWGLCLCKFGIEYVDDPTTANKIPTCHRTSFESIFDDNNFEMALENADAVAVNVLRNEAKEIDRLQKQILEIAKNEQPFDVFICYKESDENGQRTADSELAHDIYDVLTEKGYKVFYSRITLKAKLGQDYEPYIFSALNSAKVMLSIGTKFEYFNAVWVKNEWSRFLALMKSDKSKTLIPCYRNIDPYDMPKEFSNLQGQDLSSPRAFQDLVSNIEKIIPKVNQPAVPSAMTTPAYAVPQTEPLLKRAFMSLEDGDWESADKNCEKILDLDPENAQAYLIKLCAEYKCKRESDLADLDTDFGGSDNFKRAVRFGKAELETSRKSAVYNSAEKLFKYAQNEDDFLAARAVYTTIPDYRDSAQKALQCYEKMEHDSAAKQEAYMEAERLSRSNDVNDINKAIELYKSIIDYEDSKKAIEECEKKIALEAEYQVALGCYYNAQNNKQIDYTIDLFEQIKSYRDSHAYINELKARKKKNLEKIYILISVILAVLALIFFIFFISFPFLL